MSVAAGVNLSRRRLLAGALGTLLASCGVGGQQGGGSSGASAARTTVNAGQAVVAVEGEPRSLVPWIGGVPFASNEHLFELVHQSLVSYDDNGRPVPRLAQELPSLSAGTWRVFDDGTMETVWHLRADARWHDGRPLTADDVVFSWRVFSDPAIPVQSRRVARLIANVSAPDPRTVVIRWRSRYAFADQLGAQDLTILPAHILEAAYELRREHFIAHAYWRTEFVGLGPFRVTSWPSGSYLELQAFDQYFLGSPRVPSISVRFIPDDSTALASVLSGTLDMLLPRRAAHGIVRGVRTAWPDEREGALALLPGHSWLYLAPQFQAAQPEELRDLRVRQALAHALDRAAIAEALTGDRSLGADLWVPTLDPRYARLADSAIRYAYDPARSRELFREAGWRRETSDDVLIRQGRRFEIELVTVSGLDRAASLVAEYWRGVGVAVKETVLALSTAADRPGRATYSGVELAAGSPNVALIDGRLNSAAAPSTENAFVGTNRGHYRNPQLDALLERFWITFEPDQREAVEQEIARLLTTELPLIGLCFNPAMAVVRSTLTNVRPPRTVSAVGRPLLTWNAHEWSREP